MLGIEINKLRKTTSCYKGTAEVIFNDFDLQVGIHETLGIFGTNGCGKTTLLNLIAGIEKPDSGQIRVFGDHPSTKKIAYIFQDYRNSLFPWLSVRENICFPLKIHKTPKKVINTRLEQLQSLVTFPFDIERYPYQLSGGQQQFVALMRGLISNPSIILIDEPFSALDYENTMWIKEKMAEILESIQIPAIIIAHDINHLIYLVDRICILSKKPTKIASVFEIALGRPRKMHIDQNREVYFKTTDDILETIVGNEQRLSKCCDFSEVL